MATLIDKLRQLFHLEPKAKVETAVPSHTPTPLFTEAALTRLMQQVAQTEEGYYTCEETLSLLDEYAEMVVSGEDAAALMPLVEAHLRICPECGSHFDILRTILESEEA